MFDSFKKTGSRRDFLEIPCICQEITWVDCCLGSYHNFWKTLSSLKVYSIGWGWSQMQFFVGENKISIFFETII